MSPSFEPVRRVITGTDTSNGNAIFLLDEPVKMLPLPKPPNLPPAIAAKPFGYFSHVHRTGQLPVDNTDNKDYATEDGERFKTQGPQFGLPGIWCTISDIPPNHSSPMHRTVSYDLAIVFEGEIYLELDNKVEKLVRKGDIVVQRGTIHAWKNKSTTKWARIYCVITNSEPIKLDNGKSLGPEFHRPGLPKN